MGFGRARGESTPKSDLVAASGKVLPSTDGGSPSDEAVQPEEYNGVLLAAEKAPILPPEQIVPPSDEAEAAGKADADDLDSLLKIADDDVENLGQVDVSSSSSSATLSEEVNSVTRQASTVGKSPAAVFVITNEMIRRSTARSLPELFRMVPGMQVARLNSNQWAVAIRGLGGVFSDKLLVQIDGRTVYTPIFGGVYWDAQDVLLEDVERIEIIRGPGATVWGANAVNGIISITTKRANETQGAFTEGGAGTEEQGFGSARVGGRFAENGHYRAWVKGFNRDSGLLPDGSDGHDDWRQLRAGFRMDDDLSREDAVTFQGDFYTGTSGSEYLEPSLTPPFVADTIFDAEPSGGNLLTRWTHTYDDGQQIALQAYAQAEDRSWIGPGLRIHQDTYDVDFQHIVPIGERHAVVWGAGCRNNYLNFADAVFQPGVPFVGMRPQVDTNDVFTYFVQDNMTLVEDEWYLLAGSKFLHSDFAQFEYQPTVRLLWTPTSERSLWWAVSRAVRTPTFADKSLVATGAPVSTPPDPLIFPQYLGSPAMQSEDLVAWELGMREQMTESFYWDFATYYFDYHNLRDVVAGAPVLGNPPTYLTLPLVFTNGAEATSYGYEIAGNYIISPSWKLTGCYSFNRMTFDPRPDSSGNAQELGNYPRDQVYLQSGWDLGANWELDLIWRYVENLPTIGIDSYNTADVRFAWQSTERLEIAIVGRNLLQPAHLELANDAIGSVATEVQREMYGIATWRY